MSLPPALIETDADLSALNTLRLPARARRLARPATLDVEPGTGLGLYLVKRMTESLGGRIEMTSNVGEGTTFTLALPASKRT